METPSSSSTSGSTVRGDGAEFGIQDCRMLRKRVTNDSLGRGEEVYETNREKKEISKSLSWIANVSYTSFKSTNWSGRSKAAKASCLTVKLRSVT